MEPTDIILIVIFAICGLVLIWAFKNGNNIKLKKKEKSGKKKKVKDKKKEEFKEVIPKEKKEKKEPEEKKKEVVRETVKDEKAGKKNPPTNKISKITKEDFESNNMDVPKALGGEDKEAKKDKPKDMKFNSKDLGLPPLSGFDDGFNFDDDFLKDDFADLGFKDEDLLGPVLNDRKKVDPFMPLPESDPFMFDKAPADLGLGEIPMMDFNNFPPPAPMGMQMQPKSKGEIKTESIEDRLEKVFGSGIEAQSGVKEVMVGEILSGNRSRVNRELREKRKKWMK